jgi:hypothetical protein
MPLPQADRQEVVKLVARLSATYGRLFTKQLDSESDFKAAMIVWGEALHGLSENQLNRGIAALPDDYPPNPKAFRAMCLKKPLAVSHRFFPRLLPAPRDVELAQRSLSNIRAMLGGGCHG